MCWLAHVTEQFVFKKHGRRLDLRWLLAGALIPDVFGLLKVAIYSGLISHEQHRGQQLGTFHTPVFGLTLALLVYLWYARRSGWKITPLAKVAAISLLIGQWSHIVSDSFDSKGCMLLFPLSDVRYPMGLWTYRADYGLANDFIYFHWGPHLAPFIEFGFALWAGIILYRQASIEWGGRTITFDRRIPLWLTVAYGVFIWVPFIILNFVTDYDFG